MGCDQMELHYINIAFSLRTCLGGEQSVRCAAGGRQIAGGRRWWSRDPSDKYSIYLTYISSNKNIWMLKYLIKASFKMIAKKRKTVVRLWIQIKINPSVKQKDMKTRIKKDKEKHSNENRSRRGRKQKGNVFRALSCACERAATQRYQARIPRLELFN